MASPEENERSKKEIKKDLTFFMDVLHGGHKSLQELTSMHVFSEIIAGNNSMNSLTNVLGNHARILNMFGKYFEKTLVDCCSFSLCS
jgi:hypothetical protein